MTIIGIEGDVSEVTFDGVTVNPETWRFDADRGILKVDGLDAFTDEGAWSSDWSLSWSA